MGELEIPIMMCAQYLIIDLCSATKTALAEEIRLSFSLVYVGGLCGLPSDPPFEFGCRNG